MECNTFKVLFIADRELHNEAASPGTDQKDLRLM